MPHSVARSLSCVRVCLCVWWYVCVVLCGVCAVLHVCVVFVYVWCVWYYVCVFVCIYDCVCMCVYGVVCVIICVCV